VTTITADQLAVRRERMVASLNDWTESVDPCEHGHVEHGPEAHVGRHLVHSFSPHGFGADWDHADAVAFITGATDIDQSIETARPRIGHVAVKGADGRVMFFEVRP
jgi:hypothetical protein